MHSPLAGLGYFEVGNLIERCSLSITRQLNTEKTKRAGKRVPCGSYRLLGFLRSFCFRVPCLPGQMDYEAELNEIKVDYIPSTKRCIEFREESKNRIYPGIKYTEYVPDERLLD